MWGSSRNGRGACRRIRRAAICTRHPACPIKAMCAATGETQGGCTLGKCDQLLQRDSEFDGSHSWMASLNFESETSFQKSLSKMSSTRMRPADRHHNERLK